MSQPTPHPDLQKTQFKIGIITLSDRASQGVYEDKSGILLRQVLEEYFQINQLQVTFEYLLIPDEKEILYQSLTKFTDNGYHYIFTTGSTGIGPRDIAPDVIQSVIDKEIPGIMEYIRVKYGAIIPNALLSRSIAGVARQTIIYALPGSPKAVEEYLEEILKTLLHCHLMVKATDAH